MECGKLTAKLRDAVPVCLMADGKEVKQYKNVEIPDEIKRLPFIDFKFDVPASGAIIFKIHFAPGVLPEIWPEKRQREPQSNRQTNLLAAHAAPQLWRSRSTLPGKNARN